MSLCVRGVSVVTLDIPRDLIPHFSVHVSAARLSSVLLNTSNQRKKKVSKSNRTLVLCLKQFSRENDEELWCGISQLLLNIRPPESCACCRWGWGSLLPVVCDSGPDRFPPCRPPCSFSLACLLFSQHTWFMNQTKNQTDDPLRIVSAASLRWVASAAN